MMSSSPSSAPNSAPTSQSGVPPYSGKILAYTRWDLIPTALGFLHLAGVIVFFLAFPSMSWGARIVIGLAYAVSISWNINGISHNFIHTPYFRSGALNRLFSIVESLALGFSQTFYECVHQRHHMGNSDLPDDDGKTIDWLSIYRHGHDDKPENVWRYTFLSYFRDDPKEIYQAIARKDVAEARWGLFEIAAFLAFFVTMGVLDWHFIVFFLPFYYLGHCLSYLNGYFEHYAGNPDVPIAWGVSTYHKLYNWTWFNNGYHAEHHFRPKLHWTKMHEFHEKILAQQQEAKTRVIRPPHALGFFDKDLPKDDEALKFF